MTNAHAAADAIEAVSAEALKNINAFARDVLQTRGGRAGSGLGSLLEALWGFYVNRELRTTPGMNGFELAWFPDHAYNDFACIGTDVDWIATDRSTELLRVEAKSMYVGADESKGHFDALVKELGDADLLLVILWSWMPIVPKKPSRVAPQILDFFVGHAIPVARLRDELHKSRGGSFVQKGKCPDKCKVNCSHVGEPLNASGKRERRGGPEFCRVSSKVSYAANFGGLIRMLKTDSPAARDAFRRVRAADDTAHKYISFIHRNYPIEERNQYTAAEVAKLASRLGISSKGLSLDELWKRIRVSPDYQEALRTL